MSNTRWRPLIRVTTSNLRRDIDDELSFHVEMIAQQLIAAGWSPALARDEAERRFGMRAALRDACLTIDQRRHRRIAWSESMSNVLHDLRIIARGFRRAPGFSLIVTVTIALGIGATTTIFSVLDAVVLRPLAYAQSERLVTLFDVQSSADHLPADYPEFKDWRERTSSIFTDVGAFTGHGEVLTSGGDAEQLQGMMATANVLPMLGMTPLFGRTFRADEEGPGHNGVVLLSEALWRGHFGGDSSIVGRVVTLTGKPYTVIGVVASGPRAVIPSRWHFARSREASFWMPIDFDNKSAPRGLHMLDVIGRLRTGISDGVASRELAAVSATLARDRATTHGVRMVPLAQNLVGSLRLPLEIQLAAVSVLLLIACANVANLLLARAAMRRREFAVRAALGAGRDRLLALVLLESVMRAVIGGACGVALAYALVAGCRRWFVESVPRLAEVAVNGHALAVAFIASLVCGAIFGVVPALRASRIDVTTGLRDGDRGASGGVARDRVRRSLIVAEVAMSFVLLVTAALLTRSFVRLMSVPLGFDPSGLVAANTWLPSSRYPDSISRIAFWSRLSDALRERGIRELTLDSDLPVGGGTSGGVEIEGQDHGTKDAPNAEKRVVGRDYFRVLRARIVGGRPFTGNDVLGAPGAVVVNETFVKKYLDGVNPVGHRVSFGWGIGGFQTIVGVVADIREGTLDGPPQPAIYISSEQRPSDFLNVVLRTNLSDADVSTLVRKAFWSIDPALPIVQVRSLSGAIGSTVTQRRVTMTLLSAFALTALLLAAIGLYGVISYSVAERTKELGIRTALGASRSALVGLVLRQSVSFTAFGITLGAVGALATGTLVASQLFGVSKNDPGVFVGVAMLLFVVAMLASVVPTLRATRVDPLDALRNE